MVHIWQEATLEEAPPAKESKKMIGNSNRRTNTSGRTPLTKRTLNTLDNNPNERGGRSLKKKPSKSRKVALCEVENTLSSSQGARTSALELSNNENKEPSEPNLAFASQKSPSSQNDFNGSQGGSTPPNNTFFRNEENITPSPPSALRQLRNNLRGRTPPFSPPTAAVAQRSNNNNDIIKVDESYTSSHKANKYHAPPEELGAENVPPATPYSGILARELDMDPDQSLLVLSPTIAIKSARRPALKRRPLTSTKLSGKPQRIVRAQPSISESDHPQRTEESTQPSENVKMINHIIVEEQTTAVVEDNLHAKNQEDKTKDQMTLLQNSLYESTIELQAGIAHPDANDQPKLKTLEPQALPNTGERARSSQGQRAFSRVVTRAKNNRIRGKPQHQENTAKAFVEKSNQTDALENSNCGEKDLLLCKKPEETALNSAHGKFTSLSVQIPKDDTSHAEFPLSTSSSGSVCIDLSNMFRSAKASTFGEKPQSVIQKNPPKQDPHRMIFAEADEQPIDWAEKQCSTFKEWLNYTIDPCEDSEEERGRPEKAEFRALVQHQRMAAVRVKSGRLWQSAELNKIREKIRSEISRGRLSLREDRDLHANLGVRDMILSLLFSYSIQWLRIGLETLFGESIHSSDSLEESPAKLSDGTDIYRGSPKNQLSSLQLALREFIINRVLADKTVLSKYTKRLCKVPSGKFGAKYQAELRSLVLYRLLALFFFLDRAKRENILDKVPALFRTGAEVKSSKDVLLYFCRHFLSQEGDFMKHLSRMQLTVSYKQEPVDEIKFSISNLAVDLRDGVRLTRLLEILSDAPAKSLLLRLRLPAVSRLQKLHNVGVVLQTLRDSGVSVGEHVMPHQIVDSHREIVLALLWAICCRFCLNRIVDETKIKEEIARIKRSRGEREHLAMTSEESCDVENRMRLRLIEWCATVCSKFGVAVRNLTTDFSDGVIVCLLLHYYLPNLVKLTEIRRTKRTTTFMNPSRANEEIIRRNERWNSEFASKKLYMLGGVGKMIPISDSSDLPDPKAMLLCLVFMFSRILSCSNEIRASITLQRFIRGRQRISLVKRKMDAAKLIWSIWEAQREKYFEAQKLRFGGAVRIIECFFINWKHRLEDMKQRRLAWEEIKRKIVLVQSLARAKIAREQFRAVVHQHTVCTILQCWWRRAKASRILLTLRVYRDSARKIQRAYRWSKEVDRSKNLAAVVVQSQWRAFYGQLRYQIDILDIIDVQRCTRRFLSLRDYKWMRASMIKLQVVARIFLAKKNADRLREAASRRRSVTRIQSMFRQYIEAKHFQLVKRLVTKVQASWRRTHEQRIFSKLSKVVLVLQSHQRARSMARCFQDVRKRAITLQAFCRGSLQRISYSRTIKHVCYCQVMARVWIARQRADQRKEAIVTLQKFQRSHHAQVKLKHAKSASIRLQCHWRVFFARLLLLNALQAVVKIQKMARGTIEFRRFRKVQDSTITLQKWIRVELAVLQLKALRFQRSQLEKSSAVCLQSCYRGYLFRRELLFLQSRACLVQTAFRRFIARIEYKSDMVKICLVQSLARVWLDRKKVSRRTAAVLQVQAFSRMVLAKKIADDHRVSIRAAVCLQCAFRTKRAKMICLQLVHHRKEMELRLRAACKIQKKARKYIQRYRSARMIQKTWRCYAVHIDFMLSIVSAIQIQSAIRRSFAVMLSQKRSASVAVLQRFSRRAVHKIRSVKLIQRCTRGYFVRLQLEVQDYAATEIQRVWRGYAGNVSFLNAIVCAILIQTFVRSWRARRHHYALKMEMERRRLEVGALIVQRRWKNKQARLEFIAFRNTITKLQAMFRSLTIRKNRSKKIAEAACRIHKAHLRAKLDPSRTLWARTRSALHILLTSTRLEKIMDAAMSLQVATEFSKACCQEFTNANASETLFNYVRTCNRSLPHLKLIECILRILENVAKHVEFLRSISTPTGAEVFLDLVQMFRDKDTLFCLAVSLLEKIVIENDELKCLCASHENMKRLKTVMALSKRKATVSTPISRPRGRTGKDQAFDVPDSILGIRALNRIIRMVDATAS
ncbi:hypothetical protein ACA910_014452 [Epithemia clementina (nom. ined.)]